MTLLIGVTQETKEITDPNDTKIPIDTVKVIIEITHDQLIASRHTNHGTEAQVDSETIHAIVLTAHVHQVCFALEIDVCVGKMNIRHTNPSLRNMSCIECGNSQHTVTDRNVIHRWNKSRRT